MIDDRPYHNPASQAERKAVLENDNYHARAQHTVDDAGGRYTKVNSTTVTGTASAQYPKIPSGPWSGDYPVPNDPVTDQLGFQIDAQEPTGTPREVEESIQRKSTE